MNIALFGAGAIAREHALAVRRLQAEEHWRDLRMLGVYAPRTGAAETFAVEHGIPLGVADPHRLLGDPAVDAVLICSPSAMHAAQSRAALEAGKHVLCEIPLALSLEEAIEVRDLARRRQRVLMVAHTLRFHPALMAARDLIAEGELHPASIVARYLFMRRSNTGWTGYRRSWTDNLLWHHGGHALDTTLWLLGAREATVVSQVAPQHPELQVPLDLGIVLRTVDGVLATIALSYNSAVSMHDYTIIGRETTLRATPGETLLPNGEPLVPIDLPGSPIEAQDQAFFEAIRNGSPAPVDVDAILPSLSVLQAIADAAGWEPSAEERGLASSEPALLDAGSRA
jgi:2-hydroxy-4-carboxymuconate semialdehyde hemiacetal dehydrogenase